MRRIHVTLVALLLVVVLFATLPSVASAGKSGGGCKGKGCQIPEVPWTLLLPGVGGVMAGGYYLINRLTERGRPDSNDEE